MLSVPDFLVRNVYRYSCDRWLSRRVSFAHDMLLGTLNHWSGFSTKP